MVQLVQKKTFRHFISLSCFEGTYRPHLACLHIARTREPKRGRRKGKTETRKVVRTCASGTSFVRHMASVRLVSGRHKTLDKQNEIKNDTEDVDW